MKRFVISFGNSQDKASSIVLNFLHFDEEHQSGLLSSQLVTRLEMRLGCVLTWGLFIGSQDWKWGWVVYWHGVYSLGHKTGNEVGLCTDMGSIHWVTRLEMRLGCVLTWGLFIGSQDWKWGWVVYWHGVYSLGHKTGNEVGLCTDRGTIHWVTRLEMRLGCVLTGGPFIRSQDWEWCWVVYWHGGHSLGHKIENDAGLCTDIVAIH